MLSKKIINYALTKKKSLPKKSSKEPKDSKDDEKNAHLNVSQEIDYSKLQEVLNNEKNLELLNNESKFKKNKLSIFSLYVYLNNYINIL